MLNRKVESKGKDLGLCVLVFFVQTSMSFSPRSISPGFLAARLLYFLEGILLHPCFEVIERIS